MTENSAPLPPTPTPETPKRTHGLINKKLASEIAIATEIATTAAKPDYAARLATEGINAAFLADLNAKIADATDLATNALAKRAGKQSDTQAEDQLMADLVERICVIQTRAKRKYAPGDPLRANYLLGKRIDTSRALLEASAQTILKSLATDTLPGGKPADVASLAGALKAYQGVQSIQSGEQANATSARLDYATTAKEVATMRRQIQYAVDALWPAKNPSNAGVRVAFKLTPNRSLR